MKSGNICERITTRDDCENVARELGLPDTRAQDVPPYDVKAMPPFCSYKSGNPDGSNLWFNPAPASTESCSFEKTCICKPGKTMPVTMAVASFIVCS